MTRWVPAKEVSGGVGMDDDRLLSTSNRGDQKWLLQCVCVCVCVGGRVIVDGMRERTLSRCRLKFELTVNVLPQSAH
jgi:hypothetical protein